MLFEHLIFSIAIAILTYTIFRKKECLYIIIGSAYAPDIDIVADYILKKIGITIMIYNRYIQHGDFHNILVLVVFAILIALILKVFSFKIKDSFLFASIGFGAHLFEDAIVFNPGYRFFYPLSDKIYGIGIISNYNNHIDFFGIANTEILIIGIVFVILSLYIKSYVNNKIILKINNKSKVIK